MALQVDDLDSAIALFEDCLHLQLNERRNGVAFLGSAGDHHWVELRHVPGAEPGLVKIAFALDPDTSFEQAEQALEAAGVDYLRGGSVTDDRIRQWLRCSDPNGFEVELFRGMVRAAGAPHPKWARLERLVHVAFSVTDMEKSLHFYTGVLGFGESDWIEDTTVFLHASDRAHHSLVLQDRPGPARVNHLCVQTETFDDLMRARAVVKTAGLELRDDLLKHAPSGSVGFYFEGVPEGLGLEFCHNHATVPQNHVPGTYARTLQAKDVWQPPASTVRLGEK
ncbi:VOC family protein [Streptomyces sp. NPDC057137]|uniref:VOC family protein n=1 Tax=Streptomyces sp. NPDC057137 TaxID=3346030 RepID=UPI0036315A91